MEFMAENPNTKQPNAKENSASESSLEFFDNARQNQFQFVRFLKKADFAIVHFAILAGIYQSEPELTLLGFLSTNSKAHEPVLVSERFVCFDAVRGDRTRGTNQLLYVFDI
jgi:hypothetical protein